MPYRIERRDWRGLRFAAFLVIVLGLAALIAVRAQVVDVEEPEFVHPHAAESDVTISRQVGVQLHLRISDDIGAAFNLLEECDNTGLRVSVDGEPVLCLDKETLLRALAFVEECAADECVAVDVDLERDSVCAPAYPPDDTTLDTSDLDLDFDDGGLPWMKLAGSVASVAATVLLVDGDDTTVVEEPASPFEPDSQ